MSENISEDGDAGYGRWRQDTEELRRDDVLLPFTLGRMLITMWRSLFILFLLAAMGARSTRLPRFCDQHLLPKVERSPCGGGTHAPILGEESWPVWLTSSLSRSRDLEGF
jgi:hypothetical protein